MVLARGFCVLMLLAAGLAAALDLGGITLPVGLIGASTIAYAVAVAATSAVVMLATAIGALLVSDWQADVQSRQEWARLGLTPAHLSCAVELARESDLDPRYLAPSSDEALRQTFRAHRAAAQATCGVLVSARSAETPCTEPIPNQMSGIGAVSEIDTSKRVPLKTVGARPAAAQTVVRSSKSRPREKAIAGRVRLVANGTAWPRWTTHISRSADGAAEVIVLSASQDDWTQPQPEASIGLDGADSTAQPACRGPPQIVARRRDTPERAAEQPWDGSANAPPTDIIVSDDLGPQIPICAAELEVIETYLGHLLDELFASSGAKPDADKS